MIDWTIVKQRLEKSEAAIDRAVSDEPQRVAAIFRERAARLAVRMQSKPESATIPVIEFLLHSEAFGIELRRVSLVMPLVNCTPVPAAPAALLGVANLQGEIRTVFDLRRLLHLPDRDGEFAGYLMLLRHAKHMIAVRVDQIVRVRHLDVAEMLALDAALTQFNSRHVLGTTADKLTILDAATLLSELDAIGAGEHVGAADDRATAGSLTANDSRAGVAAADANPCPI
jgi:purine-binding chemotaxis protein CheW